jgi:serine/threonine protein kinase/tetratricopeptide (TPR) repeat protein
MHPDPERIDSIFLEAVDKATTAERAAYLDVACASDPELRQRVERLLAAQSKVCGFLEAPAPALIGTVEQSLASERPGTRVGPYKLLEQIGEGGMGTVWMAEQTEPIQRWVAIKVVKEGMDSRQVLARFEAERQALALMEHPNIARVLDAGTAPSGRPYFVMELVKGQPITKYCDDKRLGVRERLELFGDVCRAVQHAHQKGIIHRDLKPSNVLVAPYDGKPVVKVIDFGVAKATGQRLTDKTLFTGFGALVGTPEYMSPEQAEVNNQDIDTRSDIYSLGVLLYELLTGSTPLTRQRLQEAALLEVLRVIREEEPPRPSTRLSESKDTLSSISAQRQTDPAKLMRLVKGELDWIVMKALEKDRSRRYETASAFAADVERYLTDEPVLACPPSATYRLKKFVRRNRGQVIAAILVFGVLLAGIVGTALGLVEAKRQEGIALAAADEERQAKLDAQKNLEQANENLAFARKGNDILGSVFTGLDPKKNYATLGEFTQALKENLHKAVQELDGSAIGDPLTVAQMQNTLGVSLLGLGDPAQAIILFEKARETLATELGPDHPETLSSMNNLGLAYQETGKLELALPLLEKTLKLRKAKLGPDHPNTLASMNNLATGYLDARKPDLALPLFEEALKLQRAKLGRDDPNTLAYMNNLAWSYRDAGKLDVALPLFEETLKLLKAQLGAEHPNTLASMNNLAAGYWTAGQLDKSVPLFEEALRLEEKKLGRQHRLTQMTVANLGINYKDTGRVKEGIPLLEEAFQATKKNPTLRWIGTQLLDGYGKAGKSAEAAQLVTELLRDARKELPGDSPQLASKLAQLALPLFQANAFTAAEPLLRECLAIREQHEPDAWTTFSAQSLLGGSLLGQKKYAEAEPFLLKGYAGMKQRESSIPPQGATAIPEALDWLVELYTAINRPDEAKKWRAERAKYPEAKRK